jgi:hypothetical protein
MLEDFQFLKEIVVERETIQITEAAEAVAVLLLTDLMDQDTQEQPEELERQTQLQDQMYLMLVAEVLVQTEVTQVLHLDQEELVVAETALVEHLLVWLHRERQTPEAAVAEVREDLQTMEHQLICLHVENLNTDQEVDQVLLL